MNIGPSAFAACTSLKSITAPGVAAVSHDAFRGCTATSFLGREVSYIVNGTDTVRIEANDLVLWLMSVADGTTVLEKTTVTQPSDDDGNTSYATTSLETWLRTRSNLDAVLAYCYDDGAKDLDVLTVEGTNFTFKASDAISVTVTPIGAYDLGSDFTAENVTLQPTSTDGVYTASPVNTAADRFFMRLRFEKAW